MLLFVDLFVLYICEYVLFGLTQISTLMLFFYDLKFNAVVIITRIWKYLFLKAPAD